MIFLQLSILVILFLLNLVLLEYGTRIGLGALMWIGTIAIIGVVCLAILILNT